MKKSISLALMALLALSFVGCGKDEGHTHTYSDAWSYDATNHWHAANCGDDLIADKAAHTGGTATCTAKAECEVCGAEYGEMLDHDLDELGDCIVCGADVSDPDVSTVAKALEFGVSQGDKVTNGKIALYNDYFGTVSTSNVIYEVAENYAYILSYGWAEGWSGVTANVTENWFMGYGDGEVLALQNEGYGVGKYNYDVLPEMVNGYAFETVFNYVDNYYGVEEFVSAVYNLAEEKTEEITEDGIYTFSLVYVNPENNAKNEVSVAFTLNDDYILNQIYVGVDVYYASEEAVSDEEGNPVYETVYGEEADMVKEFMIEQVAGENFTKVYDPYEMLVPSYTITDAEGAEVTELNAVVGEGATLNIADIPENYDLSWEEFAVTVVDAEGVEVEGAINVYVSKYSNEIYVTANEAGDYTVTIESAFVTKTIEVSAELPATTEIYAYANYSECSAASIYADSVFTFEVMANDYADASATVEITSAPEGSAATLTESQGVWTFDAVDVVGEYVITITSTANAEVSSIVTITVNEVPDVSAILNAEYQNVGKSMTDNLYILMMEESGLLVATFEGTVYTRYGSTDVKEVAAYEMAYDAETKAISLVAMPEEDLDLSDYEGYTVNANLINSITLNADYTLSVVYYNQSKIAKLEAFAPFTAAQLIEGNWIAEVDENNRYVLSMNGGRGNLYVESYNEYWGDFGYNSELGDVYFNYEVAEDGTITVTEITGNSFSAEFDIDAVNESIVLDTEAVTLSFVIDGDVVTFTL